MEPFWRRPADLTFRSIASVSLEPGRTYTAPPGSDPLWAYGMLRQVLDHGWLHPLRMTVVLRSGNQFTRALEAADTLLEENGTAYFENLHDPDDLHQVPCSQIAAFRVVKDGLADRSAELGRGT